MYNVLFDDSRMNNEQVHHVRPVSVALFFFCVTEDFSFSHHLSKYIHPALYVQGSSGYIHPQLLFKI
jgi:hypothetical protein